MNDHKPKWEIKKRGKKTKYYTCKICGLVEVAYNIPEANTYHFIDCNKEVSK